MKYFYYKKLRIFIIVIILLFLVTSLIYNKNRGVLAEETEDVPIVCSEQLPDKYSSTENELELPIGEAIDMTENIAERIIQYADVILGASANQAAETITMVSLPNQCNAERCNTGCDQSSFTCCPYQCDCTDVWIVTNSETGEGYWDTSCSDCTCSRCEVKPCSGAFGDYRDICPYQEMETQLGRIRYWNEVITGAYNDINRFFTEKNHKPVGCWWLDYNLWTDVEKILERLEKARSGDFMACNSDLYALEWIRKPPGFKDCVVRPEDEEAILRGEVAGKLLIGCEEILSSGIGDTCYGIAQCIAERDAGKSEGQLKAELMCPRAENYFCCH